jgi:hypothetical protein
MNEQLQKQLAEYLAALSATVKSGSDFVLEQAPLLVQEKVVYGRVIETALLIAGVGAVCFAVWVFKKGWTYEADSYMDDTRLMLTIPAVIGGVVATIATVTQMSAVAMVWFAPRLYILEWVVGMVRS